MSVLSCAFSECIRLDWKKNRKLAEGAKWERKADTEHWLEVREQAKQPQCTKSARMNANTSTSHLAVDRLIINVTIQDILPRQLVTLSALIDLIHGLQSTKRVIGETTPI